VGKAQNRSGQTCWGGEKKKFVQGSPFNKGRPSEKVIKKGKGFWGYERTFSLFGGEKKKSLATAGENINPERRATEEYPLPTEGARSQTRGFSKPSFWETTGFMLRKGGEGQVHAKIPLKEIEKTEKGRKQRGIRGSRGLPEKRG